MLNYTSLSRHLTHTTPYSSRPIIQRLGMWRRHPYIYARCQICRMNIRHHVLDTITPLARTAHTMSQTHLLVKASRVKTIEKSKGHTSTVGHNHERDARKNCAEPVVVMLQTSCICRVPLPRSRNFATTWGAGVSSVSACYVSQVFATITRLMATIIIPGA